MLRVTLVVDGSSDRALKPIIEWLLQVHLPVGTAFAVTVAALPGPCPPAERLRLSWQYFAGDVLFVHRDAEREPLPVRQAQIDEWVQASFAPAPPPPYVRVVRMTEAWLLLTEAAIREAAGNPHGTVRLALPAPARLEDLPDPKAVLLALLRAATGNTARRRRAFNERQAVHRLAEFQQEVGFEALRGLPAFAALEAEVRALAQVVPAG